MEVAPPHERGGVAGPSFLGLAKTSFCPLNCSFAMLMIVVFSPFFFFFFKFPESSRECGGLRMHSCKYFLVAIKSMVSRDFLIPELMGNVVIQGYIGAARHVKSASDKHDPNSKSHNV